VAKLIIEVEQSGQIGSVRATKARTGPRNVDTWSEATVYFIRDLTENVLDELWADLIRDWFNNTSPVKSGMVEWTSYFDPGTSIKWEYQE